MSVEQIAADQTYTSVHKIINDRDEDVINFEQFEQLIKEFPDIVFPAFRLRHKLYKKVFGVKFWDRVSKATITLADGRTMSVAEFKSHGIMHFRSILTENSDKTKLRTSGKPARFSKKASRDVANSKYKQYSPNTRVVVPINLSLNSSAHSNFGTDTGVERLNSNQQSHSNSIRLKEDINTSITDRVHLSSYNTPSVSNGFIGHHDNSNNGNSQSYSKRDSSQSPAGNVINCDRLVLSTEIQ
jgi:hypothetical protein